MNGVVETIGSAVGKKLLMALTGFGFCVFLVVHLVGNLTVYGGGDVFNAYVDSLHSLGKLIYLAELGLLAMAVIHVSTGALLFVQNLRARPVRYAVRRNGGGRTIGSATMPYTGFVIVLFLVVHLLGFRFADHTGRTVYDILMTALSQPFYASFYAVASLVVAVHISHGFWSLFQSLGLNHARYMPVIMLLGWVLAVAMALGFGLIPVYILMI